MTIRSGYMNDFNKTIQIICYFMKVIKSIMCKPGLLSLLGLQVYDLSQIPWHAN